MRWSWTPEHEKSFQPRTRLDLVRPDIQRRVNNRQYAQKENHDQHAKPRLFNVDDPISVENFAQGPRWLAGHIVAVTGYRVYTVQLDDGRVWKRHVDHIRFRHVLQQPIVDPVFPTSSLDREEMVGEQPTVHIDSGSEPVQQPVREKQLSKPVEQSRPQDTKPETELRRSTRTHNKPDRYGFPDQ